MELNKPTTELRKLLKKYDALINDIYEKASFHDEIIDILNEEGLDEYDAHRIETQISNAFHDHKLKVINKYSSIHLFQLNNVLNEIMSATKKYRKFAAKIHEHISYAMEETESVGLYDKEYEDEE